MTFFPPKNANLRCVRAERREKVARSKPGACSFIRSKNKTTSEGLFLSLPVNAPRRSRKRLTVTYVLTVCVEIIIIDLRSILILRASAFDGE